MNTIKLNNLNKAFSVTVKDLRTSYQQGRKVYVRLNKTKKSTSLGCQDLFFPCIELLIKNKLIVLEETLFWIDNENKIKGQYKDFIFETGKYFNENDF